MAVELVRGVARDFGLPLAHGQGRNLGRTEAAWRAARWEFLRETAGPLEARVATAHTRDDQLETVFIRALRGAGARGLAGLYAVSDVVRPLLSLPRVGGGCVRGLTRTPRRQMIPPTCPGATCGTVYASTCSRHSRPCSRGSARNCSRSRAAPRTGAERVERHVDALAPRREGGSVYVDAPALLAHDESARAMLWPALAARAGIALDRRGIARLAAFSTWTARPNRVQLAGGHEVVRHARAFEIRPASIVETSVRA